MNKTMHVFGVLMLLASVAPLTVNAEAPGDLRPTTVVSDDVAQQLSPGDAEHLQTIDRLVPHTSTVPANAGQRVHLFVREKWAASESHNDDNRARRVVLMIGGAATSAVEVFDLPFPNYSWMDYLATAGFDVFTMDFTGYGLSPRPMMDDPCNAPPADQLILIPRPLHGPCAPSYPHTLTNMQSDWDELDTVVNYIRNLRGVDKIDLLGWSRAGIRAGAYAAHHPDRIEKLYLYDPRYNRLDPTHPPALPESGVPMRAQAVTDFGGWDAEVKCANQFDPPIRATMTSIRREFDPTGSTWGSVGVRRFPVQGTLFGWNASIASQITMPTLVIAGELDTQTGVTQARNLYDDLPVDRKVLIDVACASHQMVWEYQHMVLLNSSREWLRSATFEGMSSGIFSVDARGAVHDE